MNVPGFPERQGLYDPQFEKDGCGIGFVADLQGGRSHSIIQQGLEIRQRGGDDKICIGFFIQETALTTGD